jgi:acetolactate synthase I/II/III large subunit
MSSDSQKNVSERIADWLVSAGIEQVFSVTGGGVMFLNQALGGHPSLKCTFMHHEQACAMAAEGYARVAGKPAVVMLTTGPGAINALNGVYGAYTDSIPMIVLAGQIKRETCLDFHDLPDLRQLGDQEGPAVHMAAHVCKVAEIVREPADLERLLPQVLSLTVSGRPGPVWLDIPLDIQSAKVELNIPDAQTGKFSAPRAGLSYEVHALVARLKESKRPLILGGTGVRLANVRERLLRLIETLGIPMATAWTHDLIASDHPLFAGRPGTIGTRPGNFAVQAADLVLVLGSRLNIRQTSYNFDTFAKNAWVCQVDVDPAELAKPTYRPHHGISADLGDFLDEFERQTSGGLPDFSAWSAWTRELRNRFDAIKEHVQVPGGPLNPYLVVDRIFRRLRDSDVVACGNASACILPFQVGQLRDGQRLFSNSGSASMGYELPAAIGAASADRSCRVVCFAGDGSLQMNIQELQTLKTSGLNVIVVVLNNAGYLSIWQTHENFFGRVIGATPATGVELPDFVAVARAYGLRAIAIEGEQDLDTLDAWIGDDGPLLIDIRVDPKQAFEPRIKSRVGEDGRFITPELDDMHPFLPEAVRDAVRAEGLAVDLQ